MLRILLITTDMKGYLILILTYLFMRLSRLIKNKFVENNLDEICKINNKNYEIFTNYMDSHLWFEDEQLQTLFENWKL